MNLEQTSERLYGSDSSTFNASLAFQNEVRAQEGSPLGRLEKTGEQKEAKSGETNEVQKLFAGAAKDAAPKLEKAIQVADAQLQKVAGEFGPVLIKRSADLEKKWTGDRASQGAVVQIVSRLGAEEQKSCGAAVNKYAQNPDGSKEHKEAKAVLEKQPGLLDAVDTWLTAKKELDQVSKECGLDQYVASVNQRVMAGQALSMMYELAGDQKKAAEIKAATAKSYEAAQEKMGWRRLEPLPNQK